MELVTIQIPKNFNHQKFEDEIAVYLKEGLEPEDIITHLTKVYPWLAPHHVDYVIKWLKRVEFLREAAELSVHAEVTRTIKRRRRHIRQIEAKMKEMAEIPLSMHNLYRGLLRDHESICYKLQERDYKARNELIKRADRLNKEMRQTERKSYPKPSQSTPVVAEETYPEAVIEVNDKPAESASTSASKKTSKGLVSKLMGYCFLLLLVCGSLLFSRKLVFAHDPAFASDPERITEISRWLKTTGQEATKILDPEGIADYQASRLPSFVTTQAVTSWTTNHQPWSLHSADAARCLVYYSPPSHLPQSAASSPEIR